ncbi:MAG: hypothetical protein R2847_06965 [Bacteroidia bacterium]
MHVVNDPYTPQELTALDERFKTTLKELGTNTITAPLWQGMHTCRHFICSNNIDEGHILKFLKNIRGLHHRCCRRWN